jgi:hypothetical protein
MDIPGIAYSMGVDGSAMMLLMRSANVISFLLSKITSPALYWLNCSSVRNFRLKQASTIASLLQSGEKE